MADYTLTSMKLANLKCFGAKPQGFERILPVNVVIGRNNSGKSTLLDPLSHLMERDVKLPVDLRRSKDVPSFVEIEFTVMAEIAEKVFQKSARGGVLGFVPNHWHFGKHTIGRNVTLQIADKLTVTRFDDAGLKYLDQLNTSGRGSIKSMFANSVGNLFAGYMLCRINPERRLKPEPALCANIRETTLRFFQS